MEKAGRIKSSNPLDKVAPVHVQKTPTRSFLTNHHLEGRLTSCHACYCICKSTSHKQHARCRMPVDSCGREAGGILLIAALVNALLADHVGLAFGLACDRGSYHKMDLLCASMRNAQTDVPYATRMSGGTKRQMVGRSLGLWNRWKSMIVFCHALHKSRT